MIEIKNIVKSFGDNHVLKDISCVFEKGKSNLLIGASGSGKTTITKCIVGLHEVDSGEVLYNGKNFSTMNVNQRKEIRREIGFMFQGSALFDSLSVEDNIKFPMQMFSKQTAKEMLDRANYCLERVGLPGTNKLFPSELSGGMKKRVGIARAIAMNPKYLFCDEPNSGLDPQTSILIDELIKSLTVEFDMTTIVVTHDMNSVIEIGDKIFFLFKGEKKWEGNNKEILKTEEEEVRSFVYASKFIKELVK
jgi:phospholipid/cholesterol/gamma-HCH transport system ATP-binding protein